MVYFVYRLNFDDGTKYIGKSGNLNSRITQHKSLWRSLFNLNIDSVDIIATCKSDQEAMAYEASVIESYGLDNLRNKVLSTHDRISEEIIESLSNKLSNDEEPVKPLNIIYDLDQINDDKVKQKYIQKRLEQLEKRYIKTFIEYQNMKDNIKRLDIIIDEAIAKEMLK